MAEEGALGEGVVLEATKHAKLKFMGPTGCVVPPHFRPLCTLHVCSINGMGFKPGDAKWTKQYFGLRAKIEREVAKEYQSSWNGTRQDHQ